MKRRNCEMRKMKSLKSTNVKNETLEMDKCEKLTLENFQMRKMKRWQLSNVKNVTHVVVLQQKK